MGAGISRGVCEPTGPRYTSWPREHRMSTSYEDAATGQRGARTYHVVHRWRRTGAHPGKVAFCEQDTKDRERACPSGSGGRHERRKE